MEAAEDSADDEDLETEDSADDEDLETGVACQTDIHVDMVDVSCQTDAGMFAKGQSVPSN